MMILLKNVLQSFVCILFEILIDVVGQHEIGTKTIHEISNRILYRSLKHGKHGSYFITMVYGPGTELHYNENTSTP